MYQPNFDFISKKTVNIFLNKRLPPSPKLALLKKIITCYKTTSEYKTVSGLWIYSKRNGKNGKN